MASRKRQGALRNAGMDTVRDRAKMNTTSSAVAGVIDNLRSQLQQLERGSPDWPRLPAGWAQWARRGATDAGRRDQGGPRGEEGVRERAVFVRQGEGGAEGQAGAEPRVCQAVRRGHRPVPSQVRCEAEGSPSLPRVTPRAAPGTTNSPPKFPSCTTTPRASTRRAWSCWSASSVTTACSASRTRTFSQSPSSPSRRIWERVRNAAAARRAEGGGSGTAPKHRAHRFHCPILHSSAQRRCPWAVAEASLAELLVWASVWSSERLRAGAAARCWAPTVGLVGVLPLVLITLHPGKGAKVPGARVHPGAGNAGHTEWGAGGDAGPRTGPQTRPSPPGLPG